MSRLSAAPLVYMLGIPAIVPTAVAAGSVVNERVQGTLELIAEPAVASAVVRGPELLAQVIFTPPLAAWSVWVGIAISTRTRDPRVASQLGILASLPLIAITTLVALGTIHASERFVLIAIAILLVLDVRGWRLVSSMLDRERLITGIKP